MKAPRKNVVVGWVAIMGFIILLLCIRFLLPSPFKAKILSFGDSYPAYSRLGRRLKLGMAADEVVSILGLPESRQNFTNGYRLMYDEVEATTGWMCVADLMDDNGTNRLCYFLNIQHVMWPTNNYSEFGNPLDKGEFKRNWFYKNPNSGPK